MWLSEAKTWSEPISVIRPISPKFTQNVSDDALITHIKYLGNTPNRLAAISKNVEWADFGVSSDFAQIHTKRSLWSPHHTHKISRRRTQPFGCYKQKRKVNWLRRLLRFRSNSHKTFPMKPSSHKISRRHTQPFSCYKQKRKMNWFRRLLRFRSNSHKTFPMKPSLHT